jgi:predicted amidohydrolase
MKAVDNVNRMATARIALANIRIPSTPDESVDLAKAAIAEAGRRGAHVICFAECYVPGYRWPGGIMPAPNPAFLDKAWAAVASCALSSSVAVVLGTERVTSRGLLISALVINSDGSVAGWQDKEQIDPSEDLVYVAGEGRRVFQSGPLTFGIVICHEGWRYPETVRWAARRGAQVVFHPHAHVAEPGSYRPSPFLAQRTRFMKSPCCAAPPRTPAISHQ